MRQIELEAGALAGELMKAGVSQARIARAMEVSPPHVSKLVKKAREFGSGVGPATVNWLGITEAVERYAGQHLRMVAGNSNFDVLYACGLDPSYFREGWALAVPHVMLVGEDGQWVGIENVNIGYGGTGPGNTHELLLGLGAPPRIAQAAKTHAFFDIELPSGEGLNDNPNGLFDVKLPSWSGEKLVVRLEREDLPGGRGSRRGVLREPAYVHYLRALNGGTSLGGGVDLPKWMMGERVARVFFDPAVARDQGFAHAGLRGGSVYPIVIEQGDLQLWLPTYRPRGTVEMLSDEVYKALDMADLHPETEETRTGSVRGLLSQLGKLVSRQRSWVDVSQSGQATLSYVPNPPEEASR